MMGDATDAVPAEQWTEFTTSDGDAWRVDLGFFGSGWECIWGRGCRGIGDAADPTHNMGCCSLGAELSDEDDARNVAAHAACLDESGFQFWHIAASVGIFADEARRHTRVVDGACIFLNRPGFIGGSGCALHHGAVADDEPPRDWKPNVCWQLPFRIDVEADADIDGDGGQPVHIVRRWARADFDDDDETPSIPWLCTDDPAAFGAERSTLERHRDDLEELLGIEAVAAIASRLDGSETAVDGT